MSRPLSPVDLESARLVSLLRTVYAASHYNPICECTQCEFARRMLSPFDLQFVNEVHSIFVISSLSPRELQNRLHEES